VARILVADDDPVLRTLLGRCLASAGHEPVAAEDGVEAVRLLHQGTRFDALLTDHAMPGLTGVDVIAEAKRLDPTLPCIVITAFHDLDLAMAAMAEGAVGFLPKPFRPQHLLIIVERALERRRMADETLRLRLVTPMLERLTMVLANTVEAKDLSTHMHCERLVRTSDAIAERLGVSAEARADVRLGACLHDVGKVGVPDDLLTAPRSLSEAEFAQLKRHSQVGADILAGIDSWHAVRDIVRHHHERWDGFGYPAGLAGSNIPVGARIVAVADTYDVIREGRPYCPPRSFESALTELDAQKGRQFDPDCVDAFMAVLRGAGEGDELVGHPARPVHLVAAE
jgi:putative nucleotidyltransferase with HDIG domain